MKRLRIFEKITQYISYFLPYLIRRVLMLFFMIFYGLNLYNYVNFI